MFEEYEDDYDYEAEAAAEAERQRQEALRIERAHYGNALHQLQAIRNDLSSINSEISNLKNTAASTLSIDNKIVAEDEYNNSKSNVSEAISRVDIAISIARNKS